MSDGPWVDVGARDSLSFDQGAVVQARGRELALFPDGDGFLAIDNVCPHAGGPLALGWLEGTAVVCPWHGWEFDIRTGACVTSDQYRVGNYPVREVEGRLQVQLPPENPQP